MEKAFFTFLLLSTVLFGQISSQDNPCVKIIVKEKSDGTPISSPDIDINDTDGVLNGDCYNLKSGDMLSIDKFGYDEIELKIQYIHPKVKQLVFYLPGQLIAGSSCYPSSTYNLELSGSYKTENGGSNNFEISNSDNIARTFPDNSYSVCLIGNQVVYRTGSGIIYLSMLLVDPVRSDTKIDVVMDDDCMMTNPQDDKKVEAPSQEK